MTEVEPPHYMEVAVPVVIAEHLTQVIGKRGSRDLERAVRRSRERIAVGIACPRRVRTLAIAAD